MAKNKWMNINPQSISEMSDREMRQAYSELRSIARKRADRLEAAGFEARRFSPLAKVDSGDLEQSLAELAYYVQSPGSRLSVARKEQEQVTMLARGYDVQNFRQFGSFMEDFRYRFRNRKIPDSDTPAKIYSEAEKRNMSVKTLQREFGKFLSDAEKSRQLLEAIQSAPMRTGNRDYLTANNLKQILGKRGLK